MTIFNLGSINADLVYRVPHLPGPGETLAARDMTRGLGGKGANMSVAAARAAARAVHIGAVGSDGGWAVERLLEYGVDTRHISTVAEPTGHAVIAVDDAGENQILLYPGANRALGPAHLAAALAEAQTGDLFLFQNETSGGADGARAARARGLRVVHAAAPFEVTAVTEVLPLIDLLVLNEVEAGQLREATGTAPADLPVSDVVITLGGDGANWVQTQTGQEVHIPPVPVTPVDTTGAGDTFTGYLVAGLDRGLPMQQALNQAALAGAIMVTRLGTADVIPDLADLERARTSGL